MEGMRLIRLPFSPYSPHRWIFGREINSFEGLSQSQVERIMSMPTGFMGNPNNLPAFLVLVLPMFLFAKRWWVAALGATAIYCVIDMANARAGIIGYWIAILLGIILFAGYRLRVTGIAAMIVAIMMLMGNNSVAVSSALTRYSEGLALGRAAGSDSVGVRIHLILKGLNALRETWGLGVGAGGSLTVLENAADEQIGNIRSMHNFWVELLVDGGVLFAALFSVWSGWLVWRLWQIGRSSNDATLRYLGQALSLGFLGFFFSAIGPSSVIYMLPMWMIIGLSLAVIRLDAEGKSIPVFPGSITSMTGAHR
jgi:teichuronic acid biosynthesis protein TuaE